MNLSHYRYNRLGGIDADRALDGETVPYTLSAEEIAALPADVEIAPYAPPPPPVPASLTRAQAIGALILTGKDELVEPAIASIEDPLLRKLALNDWHNRLHFERDNPTLLQVASALGLSAAELDDLFRLGGTL